MTALLDANETSGKAAQKKRDDSLTMSWYPTGGCISLLTDIKESGRMSDESRHRVQRRQSALSMPSAANMALVAVGGAAVVYWFVSRESQTRIDERTRQRLMPFEAAKR